MANEAYIYEAIRTPRGRGKANGSLHGVKPVTLVTGLIDELRTRHPNMDPNAIDDLVLGCVTPVGDQGADIAKTAAIFAGLPDTVAGTQVNRFCASALEAVNIAAQKVRSGWDQLIIAGGVECMSRVPMGSDGGAWAMDPETAYDTYFVPQGISADLIATTEGFTREDVDAYAVQSQQRSAAAWSAGNFAKSVVPVKDRNGVTLLDHDEHMRPDTTMESLAKLKPSFAGIGEMGGFDAVALQKFHWVESINHVHTPGNSSGIVDGAALLVVGNEQVGKDFGMAPRARIVATAVSGADPTIMLTGPTPATRKVLKTAGLTVDDIDVWELNEAFAAVVLKWVKDFDLPMDKVNVNGGAIAMGHPLGATGAMILGTVVDELERSGGRYGLVTLCIGGGMGLATIVERV
ncbi:MAG: acetyl-CoA C-acetyltransferase [Actinobacteria bacterium]|jgi:acetyl-CoA C-acetyltransferase|nr:acetyl-CoA C-acetyltransferase [Micrococcales bacterium]MCB0902763.1 acetyl-CoA C-acetyltransferase [Actinomycetota bacterium]MCO5298372.1 acetyl-CoA C-acetyltransferase [Candidatus Nanopelagicales bacterium]MCB9427506.1 acetyl-CoA C-acetyltransferase [Actinomycetota bacterium]HPE11045.1 acetyl-CoA C-acetyltransferase [Actinomycetota bacterium]